MRSVLAAACALLLHRLPCAAAAPCDESHGVCLLEEPSDPTALLQHRGRRTATQEEAPVSQGTSVVHVEASVRPRRRPDVPPLAGVPENTAECAELDALLRGRRRLQEMRSLVHFLCRDDSRERLSEMKDGCLYLATDKHMSRLYDLVEHPNPWHFVYMVEDSFFRSLGGARCPSELRGENVTGAAGTSVTSCRRGGGFADVKGRCIRARRVGSTPKSGSNIAVYELDGLLGLDLTWEKRIVAEGELASEGVALDQQRISKALDAAPAQRPRSNRRHRRRRSVRRHRRRSATAAATTTTTTTTSTTQRTALMRVRYYVCDGGSGRVDAAVTDAMLARQTEVLNTAFGGRDTFNGYRAYRAQQVDTGFRFRQDGVVRLTHAACRADCTDPDRVAAMTSSFARREDGLIKMVICETQLLGLASFPGNSDSMRVCIVNPGSLPGGSIRNYNLGDTGTHELGHYLGLHHTFQSGCGRGDGIDDTDMEMQPHYGCPSSRPVKSCGGRDADPVHNFMDYSDDRCMFSFTAGQREDMWKDLSRFQADLLAVPAP